MGLSLREIAQTSKASQGKDELEWLLNKLAGLKPKNILEIGVHQGYSMEVWHKAFSPKILIGVESDLPKNVPAVFDIIKGDSHDPKTLAAVKKKLGGAKLDFLFIDGDHSYKGVKKDFEDYEVLVREGGAIVFHDAGITGHPLVDVYKLWKEISDPKCDFYHKDGTGVGIVYV